jgi:hypothetical protein
MMFPPEIEALLNGVVDGLKLPPRYRFLASLLKEIVKKVQSVINDPERRAAAGHEQARSVRTMRCEDRSASAYAAVKEAEALTALACLTGTANWEEGCRIAGVGTRTADNLMALLLFSWRHPDLFKTFACLGRTKLYAIARLPLELLSSMDPEMAVNLDKEGRTTVRLRDLSDREMLAYLREVWPVNRRKRVASSLRKHVLAGRAILSSPARAGKIRLEELKAAARETQELFRDIQEAVKRAS